MFLSRIQIGFYGLGLFGSVFLGLGLSGSVFFGSSLFGLVPFGSSSFWFRFFRVKKI